MTWQQAVLSAWRAQNAAPQPTPAAAGAGTFPLVEQDFHDDDIVAMVEVIVSGRLTMGERVRAFEAAFAQKVGARHAVMVNSGSSANLLAVAAVTNPSAKQRLHPGDEVLVPAVCWSTSVWPLIQCGLVPVFVDVDPHTLNADLKHIERHITKRTRAMMAVHVLGNATDMTALLKLAHAHDWVLIEDTCESLGSSVLVQARGLSTHHAATTAATTSTQTSRMLGTIGRMGTYSFYFSHHMTTGEGGMVVCDDDDDAALLRCLRAHGWSRDQPNKHELERTHSGVDPRFLFINVGYNLRPMEVQAALGLTQLSRLDRMNAIRRDNHRRVVDAFLQHPRFRGQVRFPQAGPSVDPAWFGFPMLLDQTTTPLPTCLARLSARGVENRPIVSGNFARQPGLALHGIHVDPTSLPGAEHVHQRGFFVGLHTRALSDAAIAGLVNNVLDAIEGA